MNRIGLSWSGVLIYGTKSTSMELQLEVSLKKSSSIIFSIGPVVGLSTHKFKFTGCSKKLTALYSALSINLSSSLSKILVKQGLSEFGSLRFFRSATSDSDEGVSNEESLEVKSGQLLETSDGGLTIAASSNIVICSCIKCDESFSLSSKLLYSIDKLLSIESP